MELCRLEKEMQTPVTPQKQDFSYLKNLPVLYPIEGGNKDTVLQVIGNDMNEGPKYVKKIITVTQKNLQYAYAQRTMMQIINSEYVVKLLHWQQKYEESSKDEVEKLPKFIILYMEYCANGDLHQYLTNHNPSIGQRIEIFLDILYAMRFLHQKFILHRDIKLQNIFITEEKKIKIADLGFSSQKITIAQTQVGTFGYMAPEVSFSASQGYSIEKADIWSIGFMGFQILNKPLKLDIDNQRFIRDPFMKLQLLRQQVQMIIRNGGGIQDYIRLLQKKPLVFIPQIPNALKQLISTMLIPNPSKRISFRQIYENDYLNRLQLQLLNYEEFGEKRVYEMQNLVTMIRDYAQIYYLIGFNKERMLDFEKLYKLIFSKVYQKLFDRMILGGKLVPVSDQDTGKSCLLLLLTMRKLKAIYDIIKTSDFFMLKKVLQPYDKKVSDYFIKVKNQTEIYLRKTGRRPIDQNKQFLSDKYFKQLLNEVSIMHGFNAKVVQENWM